jgi:hypothetical protein
MSLRRFGILAVMALGLAASGTAQAQFSEEEGFFLFLDTVFTTPRDTDEVIAVNVATAAPGGVQSQEVIRTDWSSDPAGQLEFGYRWANGSMVSLTYWGYEADQRTTGNGPSDSPNTIIGNVMYFGIGPTIYYNGTNYGVYGYYGHHDIVATIEAKSLEIEAGHQHDLSENFNLEWSVGLRWTDFSEDLSGFYDFSESTRSSFGYYRYAANKTNESSMAGLEIGVRGDYAFTKHVSINSSLGFSFLEGKVESTSGLVPSGITNAGTLPSSSFYAKDGDRSGTIVDFDLNVVWHLYDDRYRVWLGYQHSQWNGVPVDLARQQLGGTVWVPPDPNDPVLIAPGRQAAFAARDSITFSGFKIGVGFLF